MPAQEQVRLVPLDRTDAAQVTSWATSTARTYLMPVPTAAEVAWRAERTEEHRVTVGLDRGQVVATFRSFDTPLSLPGGQDVPVNAISGVAVLPTHRRRGLLRRWMTAELDRADGAGAAASLLIASEAPIYGRYGFGVATTSSRWTVQTARARFVGNRVGSLQIVDGATWAEHAPGVYRRVTRRRAGAIARSDSFYRWVSQQVPDQPDPDRSRTFVLHRDDAGEVDGGLVYSVKGAWPDWASSGELEVTDLLALDDVAEAALLRYCCEVDFVATVVVSLAPGHPLPWLLADSRAARSGPVSDQLWARLHDVEAAFSARRYPVAGRLVVEVQDDGRTAGRYQLEADASGAGACTRTGAQPDVRLQVHDLAGLWLGGGETTPTLAAVVATGRAALRDHSVLAGAHALLSWPQAPWAPTHF